MLVHVRTPSRLRAYTGRKEVCKPSNQQKQEHPSDSVHFFTRHILDKLHHCIDSFFLAA